ALPDNLNDERWHKDRWEPLLAPFADSENPKRFVTAETFLPGNGVSVSGSGAQPCIIRDIPEIDLMFMYKPSGWATCSTPQWQGVEGNLIRYVWTKSDPSGEKMAPGLTDVFSPAALEKFRRYTERSTTFHDLKESGYMCSYWYDGYAPPMLAQAYLELQAALPEVLCKHRLTNAWAYKYDESPDHEDTSDKEQRPSNGIGVHADEAAVNINCWLVPDSSLSDGDFGGMLVWPNRPPPGFE
ncbi:unnamed protein product, partial [Polarella glacialis]